jgi:hypothetical protein
MRWRGIAALLVVLGGLGSVGTGTAVAGTYDIVSCGAPGANGVNRAWVLQAGYNVAQWDLKASCPELGGYSKPQPGVRADYFTGITYAIKAPPGAILDRITIWRSGYRFNSEGTENGTWSVAGYKADASVIGGPLGEMCQINPEGWCRFGSAGRMEPGARADRDLETSEISYSVACAVPAGCATANAESFPFAGIIIAGSIVTVREDAPPSVVARGPLTDPGWHVDDAPLQFGATDPVGIRIVRVLVDGNEVYAVTPTCDHTRVVPCDQAPERAVHLGAAVPDGTRTVTVEATDTAGNVARASQTVSVDRNPPALEFLPARGRRRVVVSALDAGSGTTGGSIEARRRGARRYRALPTRLRGGRLVARVPRRFRRGATFRASAVDAVGHRAVSVGAPVRLRAGFGRRLRPSAFVGLRRGAVVRGRLRGSRGRGLRGREITVLARVRADGAVPAEVGRVVTGRGGRFRLAVPAGPSRIVSVISPGVGGLQGARRNLNMRVPWSSSLRIRPRSLAPGGRMRLSGRLRLRGVRLPPSGKRVELQAFDAGRWRVFATTRAFGRRGAWQASYRFGARPGSYRIRVRIPYEGTIAFDRGYSRPVTVHVG